MDFAKQHTVLIVDDEPSIRKVVCRGLESEGFTTLTCENGQEAVDMLSSKTVDPDCILLDIRMPIMTGLDALPILKKLKPLSPIIMLTAYSELDTGLTSLKSGAFDYIVKPARLGTIIEVINRALKFRTVLLENARLTKRNKEYGILLERKVEERTRELDQAYRKLRQMNIDTVKVLAETIEAKDVYTRGHCQRVRLLSAGIASQLGLDAEEIERIEYAALLHDIGKIGIPEKLLHKITPLEKEEKEIINLHPRIGESILRNIEFFIPILQAVRQHHERWDGNGYPDGLAGEEIHPLARIIAVCDSFDAMNSTRPYRETQPLESTLKQMKEGAGSQFDPSVVAAFFEAKVYDITYDSSDISDTDIEFFDLLPYTDNTNL